MGKSVVELAMDVGSDTNASCSCGNDSVFFRLSGEYFHMSAELALDAARVAWGIFEFLVVFVELEKAERKARPSSWNQATTALDPLLSPHWETSLTRHAALSGKVAWIHCVVHCTEFKCLGKYVQTILWLHASHNGHHY